jgi:hypothetical protein
MYLAALRAMLGGIFEAAIAGIDAFSPEASTAHSVESSVPLDDL